MRLTFVVIYSFIFKRFFLFVRFDATENLLLLFIVIVFPFFFAPFVFGWYSNLIKSHSTASLVLSCINPRILPISWQSQLGRWCIFQKLFFLLCTRHEREHMFRISSTVLFSFFFCVCGDDGYGAGRHYIEMVWAKGADFVRKLGGTLI